MSADGSGWCLIESDPGVFTELIREFGVEDVSVREVYTLHDADSLPRPVYGLIFLFKWLREEDPRPTVDAPPPSLFFAHQTIQNACATQAILSILLNRSNDISLGSELSSFREFTAEFPPSLRGEAISNSDRIRAVHNSFARLEVFDEKKESSSGGDAFHFISYVPFEGRLYELDGLKEGPYDLGECKMSDWVSSAAPHIEARMQRYASSELRFSLLAVTRDPRKDYRNELEEIGARLASNDGDEATLAELARREGEIANALAMEEEIAESQATENARRKHNWFPLIYQLLKTMAENNALPQA